MLAGLSARSLLPGCTPVVNLFRQPGVPIDYSQQTAEYSVLAHPAHAAAYEVYSVDRVHMVRQQGKDIVPVEFRSFYALRHGESDARKGRYRYYDPHSGRFMSRDPAGLLGGFNVHSYAPNPIQWVDPLGLAPTWDCKSNKWRDSATGRYRRRPTDAVKTEPNQAFFWSGRTEGVGGEHVAKQVATAHGGTTLELQLEKNGVVMPPWDPNNPKAVKEWEEISKSYAQQACGLTRGVIGQELRPGNIWQTREKGALTDNPSVTQIDTIDPKTGATKTIFRR
jgi:RHS repeat-associated protein